MPPYARPQDPHPTQEREPVEGSCPECAMKSCAGTPSTRRRLVHRRQVPELPALGKPRSLAAVGAARDALGLDLERERRPD